MERHSRPIWLLVGEIFTLVGVMVGVLSLWVMTERRLSAMETAATKNEENIKNVRNSVDRMDGELTSGLKAVQGIQAKQVSDGELAEIVARVEKLEKRRVTGSGPTAQEVAAVLVRDYADELRGPEGPKGEMGPRGAAGPKGEQGASGSALDPTAKIEISREFKSSFPDQYWGQTRVQLLGCKKQGNSASCTLLVQTSAERQIIELYADDDMRAALPTAEWISSTAVTINRERSDRKRWTELSSGIPIRIEVHFDLPESDPDGVLKLEIREYKSGKTANWENVAFVN